MKNTFLILGMLVTFLASMNAQAQTATQPPENQPRVYVDHLRCSDDASETLLGEASRSIEILHPLKMELPHKIFHMNGCNPDLIKSITDDAHTGFGYLPASIAVRNDITMANNGYGCDKIQVETVSVTLKNAVHQELMTLTSVEKIYLPFMACDN